MGIDAAQRMRGPGRGAAATLSVLLALHGCASSGRQSAADCAPRKGMRAEMLIRCGCFVADSGGGAVFIEGYGEDVTETITLVHYICPRGEGKLVRVAVVNGVVDRVYY
jgi:hypothetical protein